MLLCHNLVAPSNMDINANVRYGNPPHVDERHRHRYEVCHDCWLLNPVLFMCPLYHYYLMLLGSDQTFFCLNRSILALFQCLRMQDFSLLVAMKVETGWRYRANIPFHHCLDFFNLSAWTCFHLRSDCRATRSPILHRCSIPSRIQVEASKTVASIYRYASSLHFYACLLIALPWMQCHNLPLFSFIIVI